MAAEQHTFTVTVTGCTAEQASQVMAERIHHDEDYGFDYAIDFTNQPNPTRVPTLQETS